MNKEIKYIPGDLVMTNGIPIGTKKGSVYQVTESNPDKYRPVEDGNAFTELKGSVTLSNIKGKTVHDEGFLFGDSGDINCTFAAAYVGDDKFIFNLTALSEVCTVCGNKFDRKEGEK